MIFSELENINEVTESFSSKSNEIQEKKEDISLKFSTKSIKAKMDVSIEKNIQIEILELANEAKQKQVRQKQKLTQMYDQLLEQKIIEAAEKLKELSDKIDQNSGMDENYKELQQQYNKLWQIKLKNIKEYKVDEESLKKQINKKIQKLYHRQIFPEIEPTHKKDEINLQKQALKKQLESITEYMVTFKMAQTKSMESLYNGAFEEISELRNVLKKRQNYRKNVVKNIVFEAQKMEQKCLQLLRKQAANREKYVGLVLLKIRDLCENIVVQAKDPKLSIQPKTAIKIVESTQQVQKRRKFLLNQSQVRGNKMDTLGLNSVQILQSIRIQGEFVDTNSFKQ